MTTFLTVETFALDIRFDLHGCFSDDLRLYCSKNAVLQNNKAILDTENKKPSKKLFVLKHKNSDAEFSNRRALPSIQKDCVPTNQKSSVIYKFTCQCDSGYVGRTTQRLGIG